MATSDSASSPPSPGVGAVPLSSALGNLLRFVLSSQLAAPDHAFPLSPSYCSRLLDDDLREKLATELAGCAQEGRLPRTPASAGIPPDEAGWEETERVWEAVVLEKGAELKRARKLSRLEEAATHLIVWYSLRGKSAWPVETSSLKN